MEKSNLDVLLKAKKEVQEKHAVSEKNDIDIAQETKKDLREGLSLLAKKFVKNVKAGRINVEDIKDAKDMGSIIALLDQGSDDLQQSAPAMNSFAINFVNRQMGRAEDTGEPNPIDITKNIDNMSAEEVANMVAAHTEDLDKENVKDENVDGE